jgi:hypothetical protein
MNKALNSSGKIDTSRFINLINLSEMRSISLVCLTTSKIKRYVEYNKTQ